MSSDNDDAGRKARHDYERSRHRFGDTGDEPAGLMGRAGYAVKGAWQKSASVIPGGQIVLWLLLIVIVIALIWFLLPKHSKSSSSAYGQGGPQPVVVAKAVSGDIKITLPGLGAVTPLATDTVRPQVSGMIDRIAFHEGDMVKAGDLLAEIDPKPFQAALDQAKGQLVRDDANLVNAEVDLKRYQDLYAKQAISQQTLATQEALVKSDQGIVVSDKANVESAQINLGYTRITSPIDGRAGIRQVDVGNFVSAGQTAGIVVVTQLQPMSVLFKVPEDNIDEVVARVKAGDVLHADVYNRDQSVLLASGRLVSFDSAVDPTTGQVELRAMFDNADDALFPQQFVNVRLLVDTLHNQTVVPSAAIQRGAEGAFVFVVKPDHTVSLRTVILGPQDGDNVSVTKGLNVGETVVTDGGDRLREGSEVFIPSGTKVDTVAPAENATPLSVTDANNAQREQRRAKLMKVCAEDVKKYCEDSQQGFAVFQCLRENSDKLSAPCQQVFKSMRAHGGGGGGRRGGYGGGPPG